MDYLSAILWITFYCLGLGSVFGSSRGGAVTDAAHRTDPLGKLAGWLARDLGLPREMRVDGRVEKCPWFTKWIIIISIPVGGAGWVRSGSSIDCTSHKITFTQLRGDSFDPPFSCPFVCMSLWLFCFRTFTHWGLPPFLLSWQIDFFTRELISYWSMIDGFHEEDTVGNKERGGDDPTLKE